MNNDIERYLLEVGELNDMNIPGKANGQKNKQKSYLLEINLNLMNKIKQKTHTQWSKWQSGIGHCPNEKVFYALRKI